jgi:RND family efflux transporter MFP subunit
MRRALLISLCLTVIACEKDKAVDIEKVKDTYSQGVSVDMETVRRGDLYEYIETTAICQASEKGVIESRVSSNVLEIRVRDGQELEKGDTLFILDVESFRNEWAMIQSKFIKAVSDLILELESEDNTQTAALWNGYLNMIHRQPFSMKALPNNNDVKLTVMMARLDILTLYQQLKTYEKQIEYCVIRAPFSGVISDLDTYVGASVQAGQPLCKMTNLSTMNLYVYILENELHNIKVGSEIQILFDGQQKTYVSFILPTIDTERHTGTALAHIDNQNKILKDGQHLRVKLEKNIYRNRIYIPRSAMLSRNDRDLVFVVNDGIAKWQYVKTGFGNSEFIEIISGLNEGDTVISGGHYSLGHNVKVKQRTD